MRLGGTGPEIHPLALGCGRLGGARDLDEAVAVLRQALDGGVNLLDVDDAVLGTPAWRAVATALRGRRHEVLLAVHARPRTPRPADAVRHVEAVLRRTGADHLDLYCLRASGIEAPLEEHVGALAALVQRGRVRAVGLRCDDAEPLRRALTVHPLAAVAAPYSLADRRIEAELLPQALGAGLTVIAGSPLDRGRLCGRPLAPLSTEPAAELASLAALAAQLDIGTGRLALAWLLAQGPGVLPVPSTRDRIHLEMNLSSVGIHLGPAELGRLSALAPNARELNAAELSAGELSAGDVPPAA